MATAQITAEALMWCATKSRFTLTQHILVQRVGAVTSRLSNLLVKNDNSVSNNKTEDNKQEIAFSFLPLLWVVIRCVIPKTTLC